MPASAPILDLQSLACIPGFGPSSPQRLLLFKPKAMLLDL